MSKVCPMTQKHPPVHYDFDRRQFLRAAGLISLAGLFGGSSLNTLAEDTVTLPFENGERPLVKYPQKRPLIRITTRHRNWKPPFPFSTRVF